MILLAAMATFWVVAELGAQDWCHDDRRAVVCEAREYAFASDGDLVIDGGMNGGIAVVGWDGSEVRVEARVQARATDEDRADDILERIEVRADARRVVADGPETGRRESWSVSYR
ncbi:MAG: hypothetical protein OEO23_13705, partial [Gemmatimonadota bacterium]|nr:hypothetical protein [Gemmatimonadota bacterium]